MREELHLDNRVFQLMELHRTITLNRDKVEEDTEVTVEVNNSSNRGTLREEEDGEMSGRSAVAMKLYTTFCLLCVTFVRGEKRRRSRCLPRVNEPSQSFFLATFQSLKLDYVPPIDGRQQRTRWLASTDRPGARAWGIRQ